MEEENILRVQPGERDGRVSVPELAGIDGVCIWNPSLCRRCRTESQAAGGNDLARG